MGPARVSSPQVDLTRYSLDKPITLLALQSRGTSPPPFEGEESTVERTLPQRGGATRVQRLATTSPPVQEREKGRPSHRPEDEEDKDWRSLDSGKRTDIFLRKKPRFLTI